MKSKEKEEAIQLRRQGLSLKAIALRLGVAKSSVSIWVSGIELTDAQKTLLFGHIGNGRKRGTEVIKQRRAVIRKSWRDRGRELLGNQSAVHAALLYWAEGHKRNNKYSVAFVNSDPSMIFFFIENLTSGYSYPKSNIRISLNFHEDIHSSSEIVSHWLAITGLPKDSVRSLVKNHTSTASKGNRTGYLEWGTCKVMAHDYTLLQRIYGVLDALTERQGLPTLCTGSI